jgi:O-methyltransferase domain
MHIGGVTRRILGPAFPIAGNAYRAIFVDVRAVARAIPELPQGGLLLDVGGGDGEILNHLLDLQPTIRVVAVDLASDIGGGLRPDLQSRIDLRPATSVSQYVEAGQPADMVLLSDVLHHVPDEQREELIRDVLRSFGKNPPLIIVKDIVPEGFRSWLSFWSDRYISGDSGANPISPVTLVNLIQKVRPNLEVHSTNLLDVDFPNYCLVFRAPRED